MINAATWDSRDESGKMLPAKHFICNIRHKATSPQTHRCQQQLLIHKWKSMIKPRSTGPTPWSNSKMNNTNICKCPKSKNYWCEYMYIALHTCKNLSWFVLENHCQSVNGLKFTIDLHVCPQVFRNLSAVSLQNL